MLLCPLHAPEGWEPTETESEREELVVCLRRAEVKWAKRCRVAFSVFVLVLTAMIVTIVLARRA